MSTPVEPEAEGLTRAGPSSAKLDSEMSLSASDGIIQSVPWGLYSDRQRWSYLAILFAIVTSNYFDYYILSVLLEPIKQEFRVSDTVLGLLSGTCFSLAFVMSALPLARWADRGNRCTVIATAVAGWSVMTSLCGFARSFAQLAVARFLVGLTEPGASPSAQSLISDYFPPERRATAIAVLLNGGSAVGWLVGVGAGSYIAARYGWRSTFVLAGIPGLLLAGVAKAVLPEPRLVRTYRGVESRSESVKETARRLWRKMSVVFCLLGVSLYSIFSYGVTVFIPSFMIRSLNTSLDQVSLSWGGAISAANVIGALVGGWIADAFGKRDIRWYAWLPAITCLIGLPFYWAALSANGVWHFIAFEFLGELVLSVGVPIVFVAMLTVAGSARRAVASAAILCSTTLFGVTLGPLLSGSLSDALDMRYHTESLRYSLLLMCGFLIPAAASFFGASWAIPNDRED